MTGDANVIIGVHQPSGRYTYYRGEVINNIEAGQSQTVSLPIYFREDDPSGVHELNVMIFDDSQEHLYEASGYYHKVMVKDNSFDVVTWFRDLGIVLQTILTAITLLVFVLTGSLVRA